MQGALCSRVAVQCCSVSGLSIRIDFYRWGKISTVSRYYWYLLNSSKLFSCKYISLILTLHVLNIIITLTKKFLPPGFCHPRVTWLQVTLFWGMSSSPTWAQCSALPLTMSSCSFRTRWVMHLHPTHMYSCWEREGVKKGVRKGVRVRVREWVRVGVRGGGRE